jgi:hypothetical protein
MLSCFAKLAATGRVKTSDLMCPTHKRSTAQCIRAVLLEERERAARIVEEFDSENWNQGFRALAQLLAKRIRQSKKPW